MGAPSTRSARILTAVALALAGGCLASSTASGDSYFGADPPIGQMSIRLNPKTGNATIEARYIRATCTDGATPGGRNPGSIKTHVSRHGKFQASISSASSFLYLRGRVKDRRAKGQLFYWYDWFDPHTCTTGPISWSIPRRGVDD
jgi:hypothetical protein